jgi:branched-chain amino acid transport system permease protein
MSDSRSELAFEHIVQTAPESAISALAPVTIAPVNLAPANLALDNIAPANVAPAKSADSRLYWGLTIAALLAFPLIMRLVGSTYWVRVMDFTLLYAMLALGLNIIVGYAGLLDMGFVAFYAVGAYIAALLSSPHLTTQFPALLTTFPGGLHFPTAFLAFAAMLVSAAAGILLGWPTLRLRGDYLAIVTLGFGEIIRIFLRNLDRPFNVTNGPKGIMQVGSASFFGLDFSKTLKFGGFELRSVVLYYLLFVFLVLLVALVCSRLANSRIGRAWEAIREDEDVAAAAGIRVSRLKLCAFAMGAAIGGLAGTFFAAFQGFVSPESFTYGESIAVLAMVVAGGMGNIPGVLLGSFLLAVLPEALRSAAIPVQQAVFGRTLVDAEIVRQLLFGCALVAVMLFRPSGLWPKRRLK